MEDIIELEANLNSQSTHFDASQLTELNEVWCESYLQIERALSAMLASFGEKWKRTKLRLPAPVDAFSNH